MGDLEALLKKSLKALSCTQDLKQLETVRVYLFGKKGELTQRLKNLKTLSVEQRPIAGQMLNEIKSKLLEAVEKQKSVLSDNVLSQKLLEKKLDVTLPGRGMDVGGLHPVTNVFDRIADFFASVGFSVAQGPEVEDEYHNFEALNIPSHHPAREMHDTFYFPDGKLLRTHTSPVQIRTLKNTTPPVKIIAPGRVYRCDSDLTHTPMFHQIEGFMVDKNISFADLKGMITAFLKVFFENDLNIRFRPSYFPFTEPSAEVDIQCVACKGLGCRVCARTGWLEILGCGMVHPIVLENCHINSDIYSGFAFGLGVDRFAMLRYGIDDLRLFFENDLKFLKQF